MAFQRSTVFFKAIFALLVSTSYRSSAAELGGSSLPQAGARPATATMAVDAQGQSAPTGGSALLAAGDGQLSQPYPPAQSYQGAQPPAQSYASSRTPVAAAPYPSHSLPVAAPAPMPAAGPPCLIPMWGEEDYACKEYEDWEAKGSWTDSLYRMRIEMPDGTKCTVKPPGKWGFWMAAEVTEMNCKAGVWVDGKGLPVTEIEMKTAQWFFIASIVAAVVIVWLSYKMFYDTEHWLFTWRGDTARKWGFAAPLPVEDADPQQSQQAQPGAISISISNQSGGAAAPEAQPPKAQPK